MSTAQSPPTCSLATLRLDPDIGLALEEAFREERIDVFTTTSLRGVRQARSNQASSVSAPWQGRHGRGDRILQALGRRPNVAGLNLKAASVELREERVVVDRAMRTSQSHIFAAGDVTNLYDIVHIAIQQGEVAGFNSCHRDGSAREFDDRLVTGCREAGTMFLAASYPFADHGKAMCRGDRLGFVKLLADQVSGRLLGTQIVGPEAGELIHQLIAVMYYQGTVFDLLRMPHYRPTLAEIVTYPAASLAQRVKKG